MPPIILVYEEICPFSLAIILFLKRENYEDLQREPFGEFNSVMVAFTCILATWVCLPVITLLPIKYPVFVGRMKNFGPIFEHLKPTAYHRVSNVMVYFIRRIIIVIVAVFLKDNPAQQI